MYPELCALEYTEHSTMGSEGMGPQLRDAELMGPQPLRA